MDVGYLKAMLCPCHSGLDRDSDHLIFSAELLIRLITQLYADLNAFSSLVSAISIFGVHVNVLGIDTVGLGIWVNNISTGYG